MPVTKSESAGNEIVIKVSGRFDFSQQKAFRDAYKAVEPGRIFRVDLSGTEYMDSAALGMLLLLKQHTGDTPGGVVLVKPSDEVQKILSVANFDKIFTIE